MNKKELPQDIEEGINYLERAEKNAGNHDLFNDYFSLGVDIIHGYFEGVPDSTSWTFAENKIQAHTKALIRRLPSIHVEDMGSYFGYQLSLMKVAKHFERIYSNEPDLRANIENFVDEGFEEEIKNWIDRKINRS